MAIIIDQDQIECLKKNGFVVYRQRPGEPSVVQLTRKWDVVRLSSNGEDANATEAYFMGAQSDGDTVLYLFADKRRIVGDPKPEEPAAEPKSAESSTHENVDNFVEHHKRGNLIN